MTMPICAENNSGGHCGSSDSAAAGDGPRYLTGILPVGGMQSNNNSNQHDQKGHQHQQHHGPHRSPPHHVGANPAGQQSPGFNQFQPLPAAGLVHSHGSHNSSLHSSVTHYPTHSHNNPSRVSPQTSMNPHAANSNSNLYKGTPIRSSSTQQAENTTPQTPGLEHYSHFGLSGASGGPGSAGSSFTSLPQAQPVQEQASPGTSLNPTDAPVPVAAHLSKYKGAPIRTSDKIASLDRVQQQQIVPPPKYQEQQRQQVVVVQQQQPPPTTGHQQIVVARAPSPLGEEPQHQQHLPQQQQSQPHFSFQLAPHQRVVVLPDGVAPPPPDQRVVIVQDASEIPTGTPSQQVVYVQDQQRHTFDTTTPPQHGLFQQQQQQHPAPPYGKSTPPPLVVEAQPKRRRVRLAKDTDATILLPTTTTHLMQPFPVKWVEEDLELEVSDQFSQHPGLILQVVTRPPSGSINVLGLRGVIRFVLPDPCYINLAPGANVAVYQC